MFNISTSQHIVHSVICHSCVATYCSNIVTAELWCTHNCRYEVVCWDLEDTILESKFESCNASSHDACNNKYMTANIRLKMMITKTDSLLLWWLITVLTAAWSTSILCSWWSMNLQLHFYDKCYIVVVSSVCTCTVWVKKVPPKKTLQYFWLTL